MIGPEISSVTGAGSWQGGRACLRALRLYCAPLAPSDPCRPLGPGLILAAAIGTAIAVMLAIEFAGVLQDQWL